MVATLSHLGFCHSSGIPKAHVLRHQTDYITYVLAHIDKALQEIFTRAHKRADQVCPYICIYMYV